MGTMTFGNEADKNESAVMFNRCRDAGINFFDCANVYSQGAAEEILGELISESRDQFVIISKAYGQMGTDINAIGARNVGQLEDALRSIEIEMTPELYQKVASLTPTPAPANDRTEIL